MGRKEMPSALPERANNENPTKAIIKLAGNRKKNNEQNKKIYKMYVMLQKMLPKLVEIPFREEGIEKVKIT